MLTPWLLLLLIFWQPIWWSGKALYHVLKRDSWDASGYWLSVKGWFTNLWELINPINAHR